MAALRSVLCAMALLACGGPAQRGAGVERGALAAIPGGLDGTEWRWIGASCTEGSPELEARGFEQRLRIRQDGLSLHLVYDHRWALPTPCEQTIVARVSPPRGWEDLRMDELARVSVPASPECTGRPDPERPGAIRVEGSQLEVLIQRSGWCDGLEVRMVYELASPTVLEPDAIVRRYAAYWSDGDATRLAELFAESGALLEPFTETETGDPFRHEGRHAVHRWLSEAFAGSSWRAMRILAVEADREPQVVHIEWEHMDPRLAAPLRGRTRFVIAGGEIFEAEIQLVGSPELREDADGPTSHSTSAVPISEDSPT